MRTTPLSEKRGKGSSGSTINCYDNDNKLARLRINLADRMLDKCEVSLLKKGLNVAVTSTSLPVDDLTTAKQMACKNTDTDTF